MHMMAEVPSIHPVVSCTSTCRSIMSTVEAELQTLYDNLQQIRLLNYVTISCVAFLVYDILTNLDREIPLIWLYYHNAKEEHLSWRGRARRMLVQTLFIFGRYYAPLYLVGFFAVNSHQGFSVPLYAFIWGGFVDTNHFTPKAARFTTTSSLCELPCTTLHSLAYSITSGGEVLYSTLVNVILVIRLNAMYQIFHGTTGLRKHQVFLASVVIIEFMIEITICAILAAWMEKRVIEPPAGIPWQGCMLSEEANAALSLPACITAILVATIFLGLTLRLLYSSMKSRFKDVGDFTISNIKEEIRNIQPMTRTLVRDSVLFYFPMFGILVSTAPLITLYRSTIANVTAPIIIALYSFCASRLIIHTRESFARASRASHDTSTPEFGPISFASGSLMASQAGTHV
ncbi:hypothetical protein F5J12DRAFT_914140 [Pisolithus orientalis]|uniref:uncharacterized protein n=1 Tax=Pisolithus orientalis TaxID=936130 RepID=UPI0022241471|nr:uncharacterized protein F5J12DRAFT_914140 [Pisolithus orientalis]KAI6001683.1 hypothetical protein F5J12DRAFT_914140 [Pisolithus orientalis]